LNNENVIFILIDLVERCSSCPEIVCGTCEITLRVEGLASLVSVCPKGGKIYFDKGGTQAKIPRIIKRVLLFKTMLDRKVTSGDVARVLNVTPRLVQRWISDDTSFPSPKDRKKLIEYFNLPHDYFQDPKYDKGGT